MMQSAEAYIELYEHVAPTFAANTPAWLTKLQQQALQQLKESGLPSSQLEAWKHWPAQRLMRPAVQQYVTQATDTALSPPELKECYTLELHEGILIQNEEQNNFPFEVMSLQNFLQHDPTAAQALLRQLNQQQGFGALATLFAHHGLVINVPANTEVDKPILLRYSNHSQNSLGCPIVAIHLGEQAKATVISYYTSNSNFFLNLNTFIECGAHSALSYYQIQNEDHKARHINTTVVHCHQAGEFYHFDTTLGASLSRHSLYCYLEDSQAHCTLDGLLMAEARQHCDHFVEVHHQASHTYSKQHYKGLIAKHGQGVFNGKILVTPGSQHCEAHQINHNLLLDEQASMITRPQLEIFNDDVVCTHGASNGFIDEDMLFYLQSRGVSKDTAMALLCYGFVKNLLETLPHPEVSTFIQSLLLDSLPHSAALQELNL